MAYIKINNVSLKYTKYYNKPNTLKENVIKYILNFGKSAYQSADLWALKHIDFELKEGDRLGILGVNGAGKSSLLKVIAGIYKPTKGSVEVEGKITSLIELGAGFDLELTGRENIYLNCLISGFSKNEIRKREEAIIEFSELKDFIDTPIKYYSSGMNMRLGFSIATVIDPHILILDELFAVGDIGFIQKASAKMKALVESSKIMIAVSHENRIIEEMCNKVLYLKDQSIAYFGNDVEKAIAMYVDDTLRTSLSTPDPVESLPA